ncbi:MAG: AbrB/MazE/SpoVT family DNA-binding domain-containing protein [Candidatus Lokiarchaeota archaeon]|nr:AbrB/MazE/SpoVT family DNA-binding domain-containing protein [Candidatus Lokiarchaeota archaeon]
MSSQPGSCGCSTNPDDSALTLFSITKIDERGQIVIPKDVRDGLGWNKGEKIAIITRKNTEGKLCCVMLVHVDSLADYIKGFVSTLR